MSGMKPLINKFSLVWKTQLADYVTSLVWSPDGRVLAASSAYGEVTLWEVPTGIRLLRYRDLETISCLQFSSDALFLAAAGQRGQVLIWELDLLSQPTHCLKPCNAWIDQLEWQPNTRNLAFNVNQQVYLVNAITSEIITKVDFLESSALGLAWHPQGNYLAISGHRGTKVWDADNWDAEPYFLRVPGASLAATWSTDGQYLATGNYDRTLSVLEWNNPPPWLMQGFPGKIRQLQWSDCLSKKHGNSPLLAAACVEGVTVWHRNDQRSDLWNSHVLDLHKDFVQGLAFQPGKLLLASADSAGTLGLWQAAEKLVQVIEGCTTGFTTLAWHPQGKYLAAGGKSGEIVIWEGLERSAKKGFG